MIDTVAGARFNTIIYRIVKTVIADNLKPYDYFEHMVTEIAKHLDDTTRNFLDGLLLDY